MYPLRALFLPFLLLAFFNVLQAQEPKPFLDRSAAHFSIQPKAMPALTPVGFFAPGPFSQTWDFSLTNIRGIDHPGDSDKATIRAIKAEMLEEKQGAPAAEAGQTGGALLAAPPVPLRNFQGNTFNGWYPPDNTLAVSDNGIVLSVVNSNVSVYNENGSSLLANVPLGDFFSNLFLGQTDFFYDPRVLYDPDLDRFIFVVLHGNSPTDSRIVVAFSKSKNPMDGWWPYVFEGNFLGNNTWFDFPSIGISGEDLFISGNLFNSNNAFNQAVILQIDKQPGFSGGAVNWLYYENVTDGFGNKAFTVAPVSYGFDGSYGPGIYLVSTQASGGGFAHLYDITDDVGGDPDLFAYEISTTSYSLPADAEQPQTTKLLDVGDCRVVSGFYADGIIHYAHLVNVGGGYCGIRYNRLDVGNQTIAHVNYSESQFDLVYPSIAPSGADPSDRGVILAFLRASNAIFPEFRAAAIDEAMDVSPSVVLRNGSSIINVTAEQVQRWGDYTTACRKPGAPNPIVWVSGCFGLQNSYGSWIAELSLDPNAAVADVQVLEKSKVYPNPAHDVFTLELELQKRTYLNIFMMDAQGRILRNLYRGYAHGGLNRLAFNKDHLSPGVYFLTIQDEASHTLHSEMLVIGR